MTRTWLILIAALMAGHEVGGPEGGSYRFFRPGPSITVLSIAANAVGATYAAIGDAYELVIGPSGRKYPAHGLTTPACKRVTDSLYRFESDLTERVEEARAVSGTSTIFRLEEQLRFIQEGPEERGPVSFTPEIRVSPWVWGDCLQHHFGRFAVFEYENCLADGVNAADLQECMVHIRRACSGSPRPQVNCEAFPLPPVDDHT